MRASPSAIIIETSSYTTWITRAFLTYLGQLCKNSVLKNLFHGFRYPIRLIINSISLNVFHATSFSQYPLKISENQRFSDVFQEV